MPDYSTMEPALEVLAGYGPDLRNGMTSHAPMAVEALAAMGRADAVLPWLQRYAEGMLPRPMARERIGRDHWRSALGREDRVADWSAFFVTELADAPWRDVLARWAARLAPGICASATHGVIRTGHAVRSLEDAETPARVRELGDGLGYWAAAYQVLPTATNGIVTAAPAHEAIASVPIVPPARRTFSGTIVSSLVGLDGFPEFAPVIRTLDVEQEPGRVVSDMTETFARVYLANARDVLTTIVFIHGVTSVAALRSILPYVPESAARDLLRYAWQSSCALYATFGSDLPAMGAGDAPVIARDTLIDTAAAHGDEHVIKFTEACLREDGIRPSPVFAAAAHHAANILPPP